MSNAMRAENVYINTAFIHHTFYPPPYCLSCYYTVGAKTYSVDKKYISTGDLLSPMWAPELYGPMYGEGNFSITEALNIHQTNKCTRIMATFVPNEIVQCKDLTKKTLDEFDAVLLLINVSGFSILYKKYSNAENGGTYAYTALLNKYLNIMVEEVYSSGGDVFKFSQDGILSIWRIHQDELILDVVPKVISSALRLQSSIEAVEEGEEVMANINIVISAGNVIFSIIGNEVSRHYVLAGEPTSQLKKAKKVCLPGELVLSMNAWEHCTPSQYEYVIKDSHNIKIIRALRNEKHESKPSIRPLHSHISSQWDRRTLRRFSEMLDEKSIVPVSQESSSSDEDIAAKVFMGSNMAEVIKKKLNAQLRVYLINSVAEQIVQNAPLEHLAEKRRVTMISIDIIPANCTNHELVHLVDECYLLLHGIITRYTASIYFMNLYDKNILFSIVFGLEETQGNFKEFTKNGVGCAFEILQVLKNKIGINGVSIGVSTGMVYCGVVGHTSRRGYLITGIPLDKAMRMMEISYNKVSCDYDTLMHSHLCRSRFRSRGVKDLMRLGKYHVYEFLGIPSIKELRGNMSSVYYRYPILGRDQEMEMFNDILDNIGVLDREHSGMLITGNERTGKSRLLDAFVSRAENRQINVVKLPLQYFYAEKEYTVIYHILLQIFDAEDCKSIMDREKAVKKKLQGSLPSSDFCYLNTVMKVRFPFSNEYRADNGWMRHTKTLQIFNIILNKCGKICIFLDDFHYTDSISWQFVSLALDNPNVITVISILNHPVNVTFDVEENLSKDRRLIIRNLQGLDNQLLTPFACQFLNVIAIPKSLDVVLKKHSSNDIGWCEAFLSVTLQSGGLEFRSMTATELTQYNLVFPETFMITKVPSDLLPEDVIPSLETKFFHVCITNERYIGFVDANFDYNALDDMLHSINPHNSRIRHILFVLQTKIALGLKKMIYYRMNSYEQEFLKCAAAVGRFFVRTIVQTVMLNSTAVHTAKTVSEMIRIRVIECASIQRGIFYIDDHLYGLLRRRTTFSNMHHLVQCDCPSFHDFNVPTLPAYSNCKMLEFKIPSFHKMLYDMLKTDERNEYRHGAALIYEREAQKCAECGGGSFLKIFSRTLPQIQTASPVTKEFLMREPKRSILKTSHRTSMRRTQTQRISIMPSVLDGSDENGEDFLSDVISVSSKIGFLYDRSRSKFVRRSSITPEGVTDPSRYILLKKFTSIDFRNCHCHDKINCIFLQMSRHLDQIGSDENILEFLFAYSAGLVDTAEPSFALKILRIAEERNNIFYQKCQQEIKCDEDPIVNKGLILVLMGDAYKALGDYSEAEKMYLKAVSLRTSMPKSKIHICYKLIMEKLRLRFRGKYPHYFVNQYHGPTAYEKLELASYYRRLSSMLTTKKDRKFAKFIVLQSLRLGFESSGNFLEQGEIYLAAVNLFRNTGNLHFIRSLERPMIEIMKKKIYWCRVSELTTTTNIFLAMYEIRVLRGDFGGAIEYGRKILRISNTMKLTRVKLALLPSFIEIMLWTKHICEAIDLMYELYFLSDEDTDSSAITWYYALSLEFLLDAGIFLESYESCLHHAETLAACKTKCCVSRDPESRSRLLTSLWIWQLRMGYMIDEKLKLTADTYTKNVKYDNFSNIFTCTKGLECFLLILVRCINLKKSNELTELLDAVDIIVKTLDRVSSCASFIKPRYYFLKSYKDTIRGRKSMKMFNLRKAVKWSRLQNNQSMIAWILQNKRAATVTNLAEYWVENVAYASTIHWQDIQEFDLRAWATMLYPLPIPDTCL